MCRLFGCVVFPFFSGFGFGFVLFTLSSFYIYTYIYENALRCHGRQALTLWSCRMIRYSSKEFGRNHRSKQLRGHWRVIFFSPQLDVPPKYNSRTKWTLYFISFHFMLCIFLCIFLFRSFMASNFSTVNTSFVYCFDSFNHFLLCERVFVCVCVYKMRLLSNWIIFCSSFSSLSNHRISLFNDKNELERFTATTAGRTNGK